jgi:hypothetical protein
MQNLIRGDPKVANESLLRIAEDFSWVVETPDGIVNKSET